MIRRTAARRLFVLAKYSGGEQKSEYNSYRIRYEKGLIISLAVMIAFFGFFKKRETYIRQYRPAPLTVFELDFVPPTSQNAISRPPSLPRVPVPSEDEYLPEDETIELTMLDLSEDIPLFDGFGGEGEASPYGGMGPRPVKEVIPGYAKEERDRGVEGVIELMILVNSRGTVDSVKVVVNSTSSTRLERAAVDAAYKSAYVPASRDGKKISRWIRRPYRFERR